MVPAGSQCSSFQVTPWRRGSRVHRRVSYPARCGSYHELSLGPLTVHLALDGFPKFLQLTDQRWPHPQEWLKITRAGDPVYYSIRGYSGLFDLTGEYYYPMPGYSTNLLYRPDSLQQSATSAVLTCLDHALLRAAPAAMIHPATEIQTILHRFSSWTSAARLALGQRLHRIIQARIPVLPPDCRRVDYDVLPVMLADGCLANCGFCRIKSSSDFRIRTGQELLTQMDELCTLFGEEMKNIRGVFIGQHDGLAAGSDPLARAIDRIRKNLEAQQDGVSGLEFFLFGSTTSFLAVSDGELDRLDALGCPIFINVGLESFCQETLNRIKKPIKAVNNVRAFERMLAVNAKNRNLSITGNIILGDSLGPTHLDSLRKTLSHPSRPHPDTVFYLSPLIGDYRPTTALQTIRQLKAHSRITLFPYLIQRL